VRCLDLYDSQFFKRNDPENASLRWETETSAQMRLRAVGIVELSCVLVLPMCSVSSMVIVVLPVLGVVVGGVGGVDLSHARI